jgi:steroid delta-isomerase-like uncharacterized protein
MTEMARAAERWLSAFNAHDEQALAAVTAPDATMVAPPETRLEGREAVVGYAMAWLRAFPDARIDVARQIAGGATVVQEFTFTGTHDAPLAAPGGETVPATHRRLDGRGVQILDFEDGHVRHAELYFDQAQVMAQLGIGAAAAV